VASPLALLTALNAASKEAPAADILDMLLEQIPANTSGATTTVAVGAQAQPLA
jgi:hypothetical protein